MPTGKTIPTEWIIPGNERLPTMTDYNEFDRCTNPYVYSTLSRRNERTVSDLSREDFARWLMSGPNPLEALAVFDDWARTPFGGSVI